MNSIINNIRDWFDRPTRTQVMELARRTSIRQGLRITAQLLRQTDTLTKKDIDDWRNAHQMAIDIENPNRQRLYDIYTDCLLDAHLSGCISQRKGKVMQKDFRLVDSTGKEDVVATGMLQQEWFSDFLDLSLDSIYWGHSLIQLGNPVRIGNTLRFDGVELVPRKHVIPEYGCFVINPGDDWRSGTGYRDGDYADWCVEVGKPGNLGLLLKCACSYISKKNMLTFWDMFGEIFGQPMRIATTNSPDASERARIEDSLNNMGAAFWGLFPEGTNIDIKESSRGDAYNVFDRRVDRCNSEMSKAILNQTMTIDSGSSLSQSEVHLEIFERTTEADATMVANTVNGRLLPLMARHGFPVEGRRFTWTNAASYTPAEQREIERLLLEYYNIPADYFTDKYGVVIDSPREAKTQPDRFFD